MPDARKPTVITSFSGEAVDAFLKKHGYLPSEETGSQMLARLGLDAAAWCSEMKGRGVVSCEARPGSWFHGWMCNAIMNAYDKGYSRGARQSIEDIDVRVTLIEAAKQAYLLQAEPGATPDVRHILRPAIKKADDCWPPITKTEQ